MGYTRSMASFARRPGPVVDVDWASAELKACLVSADWNREWLDDGVSRRSSARDGLDELVDPAAVLVARDAGLGAVTACGFLIDHHLGVTAVVGPRILDDQQHALFTRTFFAGSLRLPVPVALPVAHRIVYDGIRRARAFGCEPAAGFDAARPMLDGAVRSRRGRANRDRREVAAG